MVAGTQEEAGEDVLQFGGAWFCFASLGSTSPATLMPL